MWTKTTTCTCHTILFRSKIWISLRRSRRSCSRASKRTRWRMASMASITISYEKITRFLRIIITPIEMEFIISSRSRRTLSRRTVSMLLLLTQRVIRSSNRLDKAVVGVARASTRTTKAGRRQMRYITQPWMTQRAVSTKQIPATRPDKAVWAKFIIMFTITTRTRIRTFITTMSPRWT